jgi:AcrR family transcriptional regulator
LTKTPGPTKIAVIVENNGGTMKGTKELIQKTAKRLFGTSGINETTMDDIAKAAGIGKGTIYHYYKSKEELFCAIIEQDFEIAKKDLEAAVNGAFGPAEKLKAYFLTRTRHLGGFASFYAKFKDDYIKYYSYIRKTHDKFRDFAAQTITRIFKEGVEKGIFEISGMETVVFAILEGMKSMEYALAMDKPKDAEDKVEIILNMILKGLLKR